MPKRRSTTYQPSPEYSLLQKSGLSITELAARIGGNTSWLYTCFRCGRFSDTTRKVIIPVLKKAINDSRQQ